MLQVFGLASTNTGSTETLAFMHGAAERGNFIVTHPEQRVVCTDVYGHERRIVFCLFLDVLIPPETGIEQESLGLPGLNVFQLFRKSFRVCSQVERFPGKQGG